MFSGSQSSHRDVTPVTSAKKSRNSRYALGVDSLGETLASNFEPFYYSAKRTAVCAYQHLQDPRPMKDLQRDSKFLIKNDSLFPSVNDGSILSRVMEASKKERIVMLENDDGTSYDITYSLGFIRVARIADAPAPAVEELADLWRSAVKQGGTASIELPIDAWMDALSEESVLLPTLDSDDDIGDTVGAPNSFRGAAAESMMELLSPTIKLTMELDSKVALEEDEDGNSEYSIEKNSTSVFLRTGRQAYVIEGTVRGHMTINVPKALLEWGTGTTEDNFRIAPAYEWASRFIPSGKQRDKPKPMARNVTLENLESSVPNSPHLKGRYDEDERIVILSSGQCMYLPPVSKGAVAAYYDLMDSLYNPETGKVIYGVSDVDSEHKDKYRAILGAVKALPIYEDWVSELYLTIDHSSLTPVTTNLRGCVKPPHAYVIRYLLSKNLDTYLLILGYMGATPELHDLWETMFAKAMEDVGKLKYGGKDAARLAKAADLFLSQYAGRGPRDTLTGADFLSVDSNGRLPLASKDLFSTDELDPDTYLPDAFVQRAVCATVVEYLRHPFDDVAVLSKTHTYTTALRNHPFFVWIRKYGDIDSINKLKSDYAELCKKNKAVVSAEEAKVPLEIAGVAPGTKVFPHQAKILHKLDDDGISPAAMMSVQPGGGKTCMSILDILTMMSEGRVKRPILLAPGQLLSQWAGEIRKFTHGNINFFPFHSDTVNLWEREGRDLFEMAKAAPRNTIFLVSYNFLSMSNKSSVAFGGEHVDLYLNAIKIAELGCDLVVMDESHNLKNPTSQRSIAANRIIMGAKYKRFASGTLVSNTVADLVGLGNLIDGSIFYNVNNFKAKFMNENGALTPQSAKAIQDTLAPYAASLSAKRSDWAFMLPTLVEKMHFGKFSPNQQTTHDLMLQEALEKVKSDPAYKALLRKKDAASMKMLESKLMNSLTDLEQFVVDPSTSDGGRELLEGEDLISPKVKMVDDLIDAHLADPEASKGKILVFTTNVSAVEHLMEASRHGDKAILYHGKHKTDLSSFYTDPNKVVLFATEKTLNTGFNFQFCTRLIRVQSVWAPGDHDQALSRIFRPDVNNFDAGKVIYFDWLVIEGSMEMAKTARLISKTISNLNFTEADNPYYDSNAFESLGTITMNTQSFDQFRTQESLAKYLDGYQGIKEFEDREFEAKRKEFPEMIPVVALPAPKDYKELDDQPFIPGMSPESLPNAEALGLVTVGEFLTRHEGDENSLYGETVLTELGAGMVTKVGKTRLQVMLAGGKRKVSFPITSVFFRFEDEVSEEGESLWDDMLSVSGKSMFDGFEEELEEDDDGEFEIEEDDDEFEIEEDDDESDGFTDEDIDSWADGEDESADEPAEPRKTRKPKAKVKAKGKAKSSASPFGEEIDEEDEGVELYAGSFNEHLVLSVLSDDPDAGVLSKHGFKDVGAYWAAHITKRKQLDELLDAFLAGIPADSTVAPTVKKSKKSNGKRKGITFNIPQSRMDKLEDFLEMLPRNKRISDISRSNWKDIVNFWNLKKKPIPKGTLLPYPMVQDGELYIVVSNRAPSAVHLPSLHVNGVKFRLEPSRKFLFLKTPAEAKQVLESISRDVGIINKEGVLDELRAIHVRSK